MFVAVQAHSSVNFLLVICAHFSILLFALILMVHGSLLYNIIGHKSFIGCIYYRDLSSICALTFPFLYIFFWWSFIVVKFINLSFKVHPSSTSRNSSITWAHKNSLLYFLLCILKFCLWYLTLDPPQIYLFIHLFWYGLMQEFFFSLTKKKTICPNTMYWLDCPFPNDLKCQFSQVSGIHRYMALFLGSLCYLTGWLDYSCDSINFFNNFSSNFWH